VSGTAAGFAGHDRVSLEHPKILLMPGMAFDLSRAPRCLHSLVEYFGRNKSSVATGLGRNKQVCVHQAGFRPRLRRSRGAPVTARQKHSGKDSAA
jgi:hypothetical protein